MKYLTATTILFCTFILTGCSKSGSTSTIPSNFLDSGLIAYYPFDGNAHDASGNNFHLTTQGATLTNDRFGSANKAYHFNGTDAVLEVPPFTGTDSLSTFAVSLWVKTEKGGFVFALVNGRLSPAPEDIYLYKDTTTNNFTVSCFITHYYSIGGSISKLLENPVRNMSAKWTHLVLVQDQTRTALYVNGVKASAESLNPLSISYAGGGLIGALPGQDMGHFDGDIDELRFYDRALSPTEIQKLYEE